MIYGTLNFDKLTVQDRPARRIVCSPGDCTRYVVDVAMVGDGYLVYWSPVRLVATWDGPGSALLHLSGGRGPASGAEMAYDLETILAILEAAASKGLYR